MNRAEEEEKSKEKVVSSNKCTVQVTVCLLIMAAAFQDQSGFFCMLFLNCWRSEEVWYQHKNHCRNVSSWVGKCG